MVFVMMIGSHRSKKSFGCAMAFGQVKKAKKSQKRISKMPA